MATFIPNWKVIIIGNTVTFNDFLSWVKSAGIPTCYTFTQDFSTSYTTVSEPGHTYPIPTKDDTIVVFTPDNTNYNCGFGGGSSGRRVMIQADINSWYQTPLGLGNRIWHEILHSQGIDVDQMDKLDYSRFCSYLRSINSPRSDFCTDKTKYTQNYGEHSELLLGEYYTMHTTSSFPTCKTGTATIAPGTSSYVTQTSSAQTVVPGGRCYQLGITGCFDTTKYMCAGATGNYSWVPVELNSLLCEGVTPQPTSSSPIERICVDNSTRCIGYDQEKCVNNAWSPYLKNSVECGYVPDAREECGFNQCDTSCHCYTKPNFIVGGYGTYPCSYSFDSRQECESTLSNYLKNGWPESWVGTKCKPCEEAPPAQREWIITNIYPASQPINAKVAMYYYASGKTISAEFSKTSLVSFGKEAFSDSAWSKLISMTGIPATAPAPTTPSVGVISVVPPPGPGATITQTTFISDVPAYTGPPVVTPIITPTVGIPPLPCDYAGSITIRGSKAPVGTKIVAMNLIDGVKVGETTVTSIGEWSMSIQLTSAQYTKLLEVVSGASWVKLGLDLTITIPSGSTFYKLGHGAPFSPGGYYPGGSIDIEPPPITAGPIVEPTDEAGLRYTVQIMNMTNPASTYCVKQGGISRIVTDQSGNQYGMCDLPNGTSCEEWAFYDGKCGVIDAHETIVPPAQTVVPEVPMPTSYTQPTPTTVYQPDPSQLAALQAAQSNLSSTQQQIAQLTSTIAQLKQSQGSGSSVGDSAIDQMYTAQLVSAQSELSYLQEQANQQENLIAQLQGGTAVAPVTEPSATGLSWKLALGVIGAGVVAYLLLKGK